MKTIKTGILGLTIVLMLFSCDVKEKEKLQSKVDSLNVELHERMKVEETLVEVGSLIDSIDANRQALNTKILEGTSYDDYVSRLREINTHIQNTEKKLEQMRKTLKSSNRVSAATIKRLTNDLDLRAKEIIALQIDIANSREENKSLLANVARKDSMLLDKDNLIRAKEGDIASLNGLVSDINEQNKIKVANLYFAQAQALETAATRTKFAPRKKKETRREALELYKLSYSLGNDDALAKIQELEKKLS